MFSEVATHFLFPRYLGKHSKCRECVVRTPNEVPLPSVPATQPPGLMVEQQTLTQHFALQRGLKKYRNREPSPSSEGYYSLLVSITDPIWDERRQPPVRMQILSLFGILGTQLYIGKVKLAGTLHLFSNCWCVCLEQLLTYLLCVYHGRI